VTFGRQFVIDFEYNIHKCYLVYWISLGKYAHRRMKIESVLMITAICEIIYKIYALTFFYKQFYENELIKK
jgi:hypothetical protein